MLNVDGMWYDEDREPVEGVRPQRCAQNFEKIDAQPHIFLKTTQTIIAAIFPLFIIPSFHTKQ